MTAVTRELAGWASQLGAASVPDPVRQHVSRMLLDYLGAAVAGSQSDSAAAVRGYLADSLDAGPATVLGTDLRLPAAAAALANGTAAHALEVDDGYTPGAFHVGAPVVSAVLAAAEAHDATAEQLLAGLVSGIEVSCRIAEAGHPATWRRGFHNTPLAGVFGAAVGVSRLLGAGPVEFMDAFGLAGSHAGGLFEFLGQGSDVKRLHAGMAARNGLVSAELARRGVSGPHTVLEGPLGYFAAFADGDADLEGLMGGLGEEWRMLRTYVKPYPCCRHLHAPIDAVLELGDGPPIDPATIDRIDVGTYAAAARHDQQAVTTFFDAQMSIPHAVAVAVVHGRPRLEHFGASVRDEASLVRVRTRVRVEVADDCERDYPSMRPARVTIHSAGGSRSHRIDHPYGEPDNPISDRDLERKVKDLVVPVLGAAAADRMVRAVSGAVTLQELMAGLGGPGSPTLAGSDSQPRVETMWS